MNITQIALPGYVLLVVMGPSGVAGAQTGTAGASVSLQTPSSPLSQLTVLAQEGMERPDNATGRYDVKTVDPLEVPKIERTFTLRNDQTKPIAIQQLRASCGCETLLLLHNGKEVRQAELAPGDTVQVRVAVSLARQRSGIKRAYVWVNGADVTKPLATLEIAAQIRNSVEFTPAFLAFGKVTSGATRSQSVTVTMDARLISGGVPPDPVSSSPFVEVVPDGAARREQREGHAVVIRTYRVTLQGRTPAGFLSASLSLPLPTRGDASPATPGEKPKPAGNNAQTARLPAVGSLFATLSVPVSAEITGSIAATPASVFFGALAAGKEAKRQVLIASGSPASFQALTIVSESPYVTARLGDTNMPGSVNADVRRILEITLKADAPPGAIQTRLLLTSANGEKIILPVIAQVEPNR